MPTSELYEHYSYYSKAETEFEKRLAADRLSNYFDEKKNSSNPADRCKAAAVADILGRCHFRLNNIQDTEFFFAESIRIFRSLGLNLNAAQAAIQLGMFYLTLDKQKEAQIMLEYYESQQLKHFGAGHFRHVNATEMCSTVKEKQGVPAPFAMPVAV